MLCAGCGGWHRLSSSDFDALHQTARRSSELGGGISDNFSCHCCVVRAVASRSRACCPGEVRSVGRRRGRSYSSPASPSTRFHLLLVEFDNLINLSFFFFFLIICKIDDSSINVKLYALPMCVLDVF